MSKRIEVNILGRQIGTATGWDGDPGEFVWFYDFKPLNEIALPDCTLAYDETNGWIGPQNDKTGHINNAVDVIEFFSTIPRMNKQA